MRIKSNVVVKPNVKATQKQIRQFYNFSGMVRDGKFTTKDKDIIQNYEKKGSLVIRYLFKDPDIVSLDEKDLINYLVEFFEFNPDSRKKNYAKLMKSFLKGHAGRTDIVDVEVSISFSSVAVLGDVKFKEYGKIVNRLLFYTAKQPGVDYRLTKLW